jgi:hypothetical protein
MALIVRTASARIGWPAWVKLARDQHSDLACLPPQLKVKNPAAPAVRREAEEEWRSVRRR